MKLSTLAALLGFTTLAVASPLLPSRTLGARQANDTATAPCAQVSQHIYGDGTTVVQLQVPAKMAWECLNDVPFNASSAKRLIKALRPYMDWQSTLTVLKNPPAEYVDKVQPAVDILGGLDQIDARIDSGSFKNEYDFGWTLYMLIHSAHDGHFAFIPDSVGSIFTFGRPTPLVSVSADGEQLPAVFVYADVLGMQFQNISYTPSPVIEIDGRDVTEFLENWSQFGALQDRDALYNNVFYELAQVSLGTSGAGTGTFTGGGRGRFVYPGDTTTLTFANGSTHIMENYARPVIPFRSINTGEDLAARWFSWGTAGDDFVQSETQETKNTAPSAAVDITGAAAPGFPTPVMAGPMNLINGFYINAAGYEDVAVLQVPNFVASSSAELDFQRLTRQFIPQALADGKTKLIIDLQANGGGTVLQGYDMFKQLFPNIEPYGANRFRAHEAMDLVGQSFSSFASQFPRVRTYNSTISFAQSSFFDYHQDMKLDETPFTSWTDKIGPDQVNGDLYTKLTRWNLSDVYVPYVSGGINVTGYASLANVTGAPKFPPENIVIVTDGYCASTCTIFSELMKQQAGVKTIAMGGRSNKNPIQAIGGVKGVNNFQLGFVQQNAQYAVRFMPSLNSSILRRDYYSNIVFSRSLASGVNTRDGLRQNDTSGVALQFIYEEADCRLYYTPEMTVDITSLWKAAADVQWGTSSKCVATSSYGKRDANKVTTKLSLPAAGVRVAQADAVKQMQAFEDSFKLETECKMASDGFMEP
ncbi:peptidase S41 family protein-like protein [Decorospora gaudefroyi]|uniref:Peptidase S41 family protein-like protein n=1 Tax=Decorospora gaudefroyi TaxID=184978 RepID=A0A6A5K4I8_9PLEO|nr:peptidase S41 family protein-like protein [Decorospora gaudefroyi]